MTGRSIPLSDKSAAAQATLEMPLVSREDVGEGGLSAAALQEALISAADAWMAPASGVRPRVKRVQLSIKRAFDVGVSSFALATLALPMLVIAVAIAVDSRGPIIYRQSRIKAGGKPFTMFKFRSMVANADDLVPELLEQNESTGPLFKIRSDPRKTRVGRMLRRTSLDELPQLFNVLRGDLSLVGPRPPLSHEVDAYEWQHWQRLAMPQGMTGLWQVSGRSLLSFEEMLRLDLEYINRWSLLLDLKVLLKTVPAVISGRGAF